MAAVRLAGGTAVLPAAALADPSDDEPAAGRIDPDRASGKAALDGKGRGTAIRLLSLAALRYPSNADLQNQAGRRRAAGSISPSPLPRPPSVGGPSLPVARLIGVST